ncbi:MAG: ExbD/TolR family protein [Prevotella sp.]
MIKDKKKSIPALNTASLPDLIFTVLFFFLIVTHLRQDEMKVKYDTPEGTRLEKLTRRSATSYIYVGRPIDAHDKAASGDMVIQLNDKISTIDDIASFISSERKNASAEDLNRMVVDIKADRRVKMGTIIDIKQMLRRHNALKIRYSAKEKNED